MSATAVLSTEADADLAGLFALVAEDSGIERAELILRRINAAIAALADWPGIGRRHDDFADSPRLFAVPPWLIIYEAQSEGHGIFIWRVVDGRRDLPAIIPPSTLTASRRECGDRAVSARPLGPRLTFKRSVRSWVSNTRLTAGSLPLNRRAAHNPGRAESAAGTPPSRICLKWPPSKSPRP